MVLIYILFHFFFFFQAEDGIRDLTVTGVQTCALPISSLGRPRPGGARLPSGIPRGPRVAPPASDHLQSGARGGTAKGRLGSGRRDAPRGAGGRSARAGSRLAAVSHPVQGQADLSRERGIRLQLLRGGRGRSPTVATACRVVRRGGLAGAAPTGGGDVREPEPSGADGGAHRSGGTRRRRDGPPPSRSADP